MAGRVWMGGVMVVAASLGAASAAHAEPLAPTFQKRVVSTLANGARSVFAADLDGDGDQDLLSASSEDDTIAWYESDGGSPPTLTPHVITSAADVAVSVFAADVDADGDADVLSASAQDGTIAWFENDGAGGFTQHVITSLADGPRSVFAIDMDGDGDVDVLSGWEEAGDDTIAWYENDGVGLGGAPGTPGFTERVITDTALGAWSVLGVDLDGDGDTDVVAGMLESDQIVWFENDGVGPPGVPGFTEHVLAAGVDLVIAVFAADVDGDGDADVVSASSDDDTIAWYENDGVGPPGVAGFTKRVVATDADVARGVFVADLDADGDADILSASEADDTVAWYESDGVGPPTGPSFVKHVIASDSDGARSVFCVDADGDGDTDVISASALDDTVAWYESDGGSRVYNVTEDLSSATVAEGIGSALHGDLLLAQDGVFGDEASIDFGGKAVELRSRVDVTQPPGGVYTLADEGTLDAAMAGATAREIEIGATAVLLAAETAPGAMALDGSVLVPAGAVAGIGAGDGVSVGSSGSLSVGDGGGLVITAPAGGVVDGEVSIGAGAFVFFDGDLSVSAGGEIACASGAHTILGGAWDCAIDDTARFDLGDAELWIDGGAGTRVVEVMSADEGPTTDGLGAGAGRYPIGVLRVFGGVTAELADARDNDGAGQGVGEAIYVSELRVEATAVLNTNGFKVYYETLVLDGAVDDGGNLIEIVPPPACVGDLDDDADTDVFDFGVFASGFGSTGLDPFTGGDLDGDGDVDVFDFGVFAGDFGCGG